MAVKLLALDPGKSTGYFYTDGYEPIAWGSERDARRILERVGNVDVVVFEDALDLDEVEPLRSVFTVPWVGVKPEQLQRNVLGRVLGRKLFSGPLARQEAVKRVFGRPIQDVHALDSALLAIWWLTGSQMASWGDLRGQSEFSPAGDRRTNGAPDLGALKVWGSFTIQDEFGEETYQIVPPNTADPASGMVSWASPLVQAVIGKQVGDQVVVKSPGGDWTCRLVRIAEYE